MAERRMIAKTIIGSDVFISLPIPSQVLYFHLSINAADKGILKNTYAIIRSLDIDKLFLKPLLIAGFIVLVDINVYNIVHWDINNGIAETAKKRISYEYRKWRFAVLKRDNFTCRICNDKGLPLHAHHIKEFCKNEGLRYELSNGMTLCLECHKAVHKERRMKECLKCLG